ncbi:MAG TPA: hypothetical protein VM537_01925 [Anaerolineae bacterium]|nr:hypothetical protein [Anaerolineae bacterium]
MASEGPQQVGKYEIIEELGRGGFAVVYKALDTTLNRIVAVKVLNRHSLRDARLCGRLSSRTPGCCTGQMAHRA